MGLVNIGSVHEPSIAKLQNLVSGVVGFREQYRFALTAPVGTLRKRPDELGWTATEPLNRGIAKVYANLKNEV